MISEKRYKFIGGLRYLIQGLVFKLRRFQEFKTKYLNILGKSSEKSQKKQKQQTLSKYFIFEFLNFSHLFTKIFKYFE